MRKYNKITISKSSFYRAIAATLTVSGVSLLSPMMTMAQTFVPPTAAGTAIDNTATGTYEDPNAPGQRINATSNKVTAIVAEIAGVTNTTSGTLDINLGSVTTNDGLDFSFLITNVGNAPGAFHIPTATDITIIGGSLGTSTASIPAISQRSANIFVTAINGVALPTAVALPLDGLTTNPTFVNAVAVQTGFTLFDGSVPAGGSFKVVVPVTVTETNANQPVSVQLGNANAGATFLQNVDQTGALAGDVYTVNVGAPPVNAVKEAAAKDTQILAVQINNLALATVLKTRTAYIPGAPANLQDDTLAYRLDLRVESSTTIPSTSPAPLLPTAITVDSLAANRILISDAVPALTTLDTTFGAGPVTIGGVTWTKVYSIQPIGTTPTGAGQNWSTTIPVGTITRVGFITSAASLPSGYTTTVDTTGLQIRVTTTGVLPAGGTIANIAQVFGQTATGAISSTNPLVYDESGDQNPNNYEGTTPPTTTFTTPATSPTGVADPANQGIDGLNTNTGSGTGGEVNIFTINPSGIILNGPLGQPGAIGPDATSNTDFVNKSAVDVPAGAVKGTPSGFYNPAAITFANTVANPSSNTAQLDNVILEPISAQKAATATGKTLADYQLTTAQNGAPLINGTTVTIAYPLNSTPTGTGRTALYTLTAGNFVLTSSTTAGSPDVTPTPIKIASLAVNDVQDYNVIIDLPIDSVVTTGYSVPVVAYVDSSPASVGFKTVATEDTPFNIKIDRAYTGYLSLFKESRLSVGTGPALSVPNDANFSTVSKTPAPGNILEYRITYENISTIAPLAGIGNAILNANNIVITEDGAAGTNNWASTTTAVPSTAADALGAITFFVGNTPSFTTDTAVNKYIDTISTLAPGGTGNLVFQRKVN